MEKIGDRVSPSLALWRSSHCQRRFKLRASGTREQIAKDRLADNPSRDYRTLDEKRDPGTGFVVSLFGDTVVCLG